MEPWLFAKALGRHWWALMSSAAFTLLGLYAAIRNEGNLWVVRSTYTFGAAFLLVAAYLAWRDEYVRATGLEARFDRPKLVISIGSVWWGAENDGKLFMALNATVANQVGPQTAVTNWQVELRDSKSGRIAYGEFRLPSLDPMTFGIGGGSRGVLKPENNLQRTSSINPVPTGGLASGWLYAKFLSLDANEFDSDVTSLAVRAVDVVSNGMHEGVTCLARDYKGIYIPGTGLMGETRG